MLWPEYEIPDYSAEQFLQGIAGTLELFHRSTLSFQRVVEEATGHPVAVFQRIDQAGYKLPIDERILADTDTLMVFGLDHLLSEQDAAPEEIAGHSGVAQARGHVPLLGAASRRRVYKRLRATSGRVSSSRRRARSTPAALRAVHALADESARRSRSQPLGFRPAVVKRTNEISPLTSFRDLDKKNLLNNVPTLNFHPHLPHYELTGDTTQCIFWRVS